MKERRVGGWRKYSTKKGNKKYKNCSVYIQWTLYLEVIIASDAQREKEMKETIINASKAFHANKELN